MSAVENNAPLRIRDATLSGRISTDLSDLVRFRHLIWYMAVTSLSVESRGTKLGRSWWIIEPILLVGVYTVLIVGILRNHTPNFPLVVGAAIIAFEFFSRSVTRSMGMLRTAQTSMLHVGFPRSVIPLAVTLSEAIRFVISVAAFIVIAALVGVIPSPATAIAIPFMVIEILFTIGASYFFAASGIFFRDLVKITEYLFWILFQLGCGMFTLAQVPPGARNFVLANPFTTFFEGLRSPLLYSSWPDVPLGVIGGVTLASILLFVGGYVYFLQRQGSFSKVLV